MMNFDEIVGKKSDLEPKPVSINVTLPAERHRVFERMIERGISLDAKDENGTPINTQEHVMTKLIIGLTHEFEEFEEKQKAAAEKKRKEDEDRAKADAAKSNTTTMPGTKPNQRAA
jgi:hypothetical protein